MKATIESAGGFTAKLQRDGKTTYQLVSPELLTAVKMGKLVDTKLVITTNDGEATGKVSHHAH